MLYISIVSQMRGYGTECYNILYDNEEIKAQLLTYNAALISTFKIILTTKGMNKEDIICLDDAYLQDFLFNNKLVTIYYCE